MSEEMKEPMQTDNDAKQRKLLLPQQKRWLTTKIISTMPIRGTRHKIYGRKKQFFL